MPETAILKVNNPEPLREIDTILARYEEMKSKPSAIFETLALNCNANEELRKRLPDAIVQKFKENAENSRLGFRTDRPDVGNGKARDGGSAGYPVPVIRECMIEAVLNGVYPFGNEFNIVAANAYITKEGFTGKMRRDPRFSDLRIEEDVPVYEDARSGSDLRAIVPFTATWKFNGKPDSLKGRIPIRVNRGMGDDAILGKAERKIRARIWTVATGSTISDGDADDPGRGDAAPAPKARKGFVDLKPGSIEDMTGGEGVDDVRYEFPGDAAKKVEPRKTEEKAPAPAAPVPEGKTEKPAESAGRSVYAELAKLMEISHVSDSEILGYAESVHAVPAMAIRIEEIDEATVRSWVASWSSVMGRIKETARARK